MLDWIFFQDESEEQQSIRAITLDHDQVNLFGGGRAISWQGFKYRPATTKEVFELAAAQNPQKVDDFLMISDELYIKVHPS